MPTVKGPTGTASGLESDIDVLLLGVRQHLAQAFFASDAGLLHPAIRCAKEMVAGIVDPDIPGANVINCTHSL